MRIRMLKGFTLIELLIVVAIIAILAAIAVPNFLEAQVRSKVGRAKTDMRTIANALESYRVDTNKYPPDGMAYNDLTGISPWKDFDPTPECMLRMLTTPVAYLTSMPEEVFPNISWGKKKGPYYYTYAGPYAKNWWLYGPGAINKGTRKDIGKEWILVSYGPDRIASEGVNALYGDEFFAEAEYANVQEANFGQFRTAIYDATNGTISNGDIIRMGP